MEFSEQLGESRAMASSRIQKEMVAYPSDRKKLERLFQIAEHLEESIKLLRLIDNADGQAA